MPKISTFIKTAIPHSLRHLLAVYLNYVVKKYLEGSFGVLMKFSCILFITSFTVPSLGTVGNKDDILRVKQALKALSVHVVNFRVPKE
jgi:hypothetical protein